MSSNRHNSADRGSPESSQIPIRKQSMELTDTCSSSRSKELKERSSEGSGTPRNSAVVNDGVVNDSVVHDGVVNDAVFGTIENGRRRPNYRNVRRALPPVGLGCIEHNNDTDADRLAGSGPRFS